MEYIAYLIIVMTIGFLSGLFIILKELMRLPCFRVWFSISVFLLCGVGLLWFGVDPNHAEQIIGLFSWWVRVWNNLTGFLKFLLPH